MLSLSLEAINIWRQHCIFVILGKLFQPCLINVNIVITSNDQLELSIDSLDVVNGALEAGQTAVLCQVAAMNEDVDLRCGVFGRVWSPVVVSEMTRVLIDGILLPGCNLRCLRIEATGVWCVGTQDICRAL